MSDGTGEIRAANPIKRLDALFAPWNHSDAPGLVIGVSLKGERIYRRGFGLSSIEHGTANTPSTRMRIGSTSKHFACLAVLLLEEEGKLNVNAPVRTYLPELDGVAGEPTLREFMNHTSGVRDPYDLAWLLLCGGYPALLPEGLGLELTRRFTGNNFPRGERMVYCNNGYHLISLVVERVSGEAFGTFLKKRILAPLGMHQTELLTTDMRIVPGLATFHMPQADGSFRRGIYPIEEILGSGGIISAIDDMLTWLTHLRGQKTVGSAHVWERMLERPRYSSGVYGDYCLGLIRETYRGTEAIHHGGNTLGCTCQMLTVPAHELDICLMFNRMDGPAATFAFKVVDAVLGDEVLAPSTSLSTAEKHKAVLGRWYSPATRRVFAVQECPLPSQNCKALTLSVHQQVSGILREIPGALLLTSAGHGNVEIRLPADVDSKPDILDFVDSGHMERFERLPDTAPAATELAGQLLGRYRYDDFDVELAVTLEGKTLYLDLLPRYGTARFQLEPFSDSVLGGNLITSLPLPAPTPVTLVVERKQDAVAGLWLSSTRTRNLWLERR